MARKLHRRSSDGAANETHNHLIASLSPPARQSLINLCTAVPIPQGTLLNERNEVPTFAYFLTSGLASVLTEVASEQFAHVSIIGTNGLVDSAHLLGDALVSTRCVMLVDGTALRIRLETLRTLFKSSDEIRAIILKYVQIESLTTSQYLGCYRVHRTDERLALWLLTLSDRTSTRELRVTQEMLAAILGVRRTTVTQCAVQMQQKGLIAYKRGRMWLADRDGLEKTACHCYKVIRDVYSTLISNGNSGVEMERH